MSFTVSCGLVLVVATVASGKKDTIIIFFMKKLVNALLNVVYTDSNIFS